MAKRKASTLMDSNEEATSTSVVQPEDVDEGHRFGNFRNYYAFHPTSARLRHLTDILTYIGKNCSKTTKTFEYCDLGCNEGDLTMEVADALEQQVDCPVHFTGIDMDTVLIDRAKKKLVSNDKASNDRLTGEFAAGNVCTELRVLLNDKSKGRRTGEFVAGNVCTDLDTLLEDDSVDLTSLFSTTMWIHLHAGDDGLRKLLEQVCRKTTQFVLIEPQPSKWYV